MQCRVQSEDFDVETEIAALCAGRDDVGAIATFVGKVRGRSGDKTLVSMTLEHYPGMTEAELERIAEAAQQRFALLGVGIVHRVGTLRPGDNIVLVTACAPHRQDAFAGASYLMDFLKTSATFWKQETVRGATGELETQWVEARDSDEAAIARWQTVTAG